MIVKCRLPECKEATSKHEPGASSDIDPQN